MNRNAWVGLVAVVVIIIGGVLLFTAKPPASTQTSNGGTLEVVAAENFWGSLVSQIGGTHVQVLSIVSDPNADPHEYESNAIDARAVSTADYVIENGAGYDSWTDKLLTAGSNNPNRKVLNVGKLLGKKEGDNPHMWYNPAYVNQVIAQMEQDLIALDPADAAYYRAQYATLQSNLAEYQGRITAIKQQYGGTEVACNRIYLRVSRYCGWPRPDFPSRIHRRSCRRQ